MKKFVVALLLQAWPLLAQHGTTAELTGTATNAGRKLPGVIVNLSSNVLPTARSTLTGDNGGYRFALLPPGDYIVRFELQGFAAAEERVHIAPAEIAKADVEMAPAPLHDELTVTSSSHPEDAAIAMHVDRPTLENLPGPHDIRSAVVLSPSTNTLGTRGGIVISGAPSWDSVYLIDGVSAGEYLTGQPQNVVL
ncbi:MAG TPA: carboxypeptidase-like regulatory domain-containing protein, partial [Thermoanaerobaculia bacterium]|nr:carboxypeptidase-like regulatory domain-containing protein [Thermoanaerobaculia bacterium]